MFEAHCRWENGIENTNCWLILSAWTTFNANHKRTLYHLRKLKLSFNHDSVAFYWVHKEEGAFHLLPTTKNLDWIFRDPIILLGNEQDYWINNTFAVGSINFEQKIDLLILEPVLVR